MKYCFNAKPNVDYKKYGFVEDDTEWVVWRNTRRITIKKRDMSMQFNMLTNEMLKIFMDMVKDNVVILVKTSGIRKPKPHCLDLTDEEYEAVLKMRDKKRQEEIELCDYVYPIDDLTIHELDLSVRSFNCLRRVDLVKAVDICKHTENELLKIRNFGKRCLKEVKDKLALYGLELKK